MVSEWIWGPWLALSQGVCVCAVRACVCVCVRWAFLVLEPFFSRGGCAVVAEGACGKSTVVLTGGRPLP